jgi:Tfp pilus assembly protein PilF
VLGLALAATLSTAAGAHAQKRAGGVRLDSLVAAVRADSNEPRAHYQLALGYWDAKRYDEAEQSLRQALVLAPQYADAYLALAALPLSRGDKYWRQRIKREGRAVADSAVLRSAADYRRAFLLNPLVDLRVLGKFEGVTDGFSFGDYFIPVVLWWQSDYKKAINDFREGDYERAFARLDKLARDERSGDRGRDAPTGVLWYRALAAAHTKRFDVAIEDMAVLTGVAVAEEREDRLTAIPMHANEFRYALATMLYLAGRFHEAAPVFRRALEFDLSLYPAHVQLARMHEALGEWDDAVRERRAAVAANPDDADLLVDLGVTLWRAGRLEEAGEPLAAAERLAPRNARAPYFAAVVAAQAGRQADARAAFTRFVPLAPARLADQVVEARGWLEANP